jgi:hypothetical protein
MKLTKDQYIAENIKLSYKNTTIILDSIEKNLNTIKELSHQTQTSKTKQESINNLTKIKDISIESILEKCNMLKSSIDRYTIPYEDVRVPKEIKYIKLHNIPGGSSIGDPSKNPRFREKISKTNLPPMLTPILVDDDTGDDCE